MSADARCAEERMRASRAIRIVLLLIGGRFSTTRGELYCFSVGCGIEERGDGSFCVHRPALLSTPANIVEGSGDPRRSRLRFRRGHDWPTGHTRRRPVHSREFASTSSRRCVPVASRGRDDAVFSVFFPMVFSNPLRPSVSPLH